MRGHATRRQVIAGVLVPRGVRAGTDAGRTRAAKGNGRRPIVYTRKMLEEIRSQVDRGENFALETTLSGRGYARLIPAWQTAGYRIKLFFLKLDSPELAIARIGQRVRNGGHNIPEPAVRRRFSAGFRNFGMLYKPLVDEWALYDNSGATPRLLEEGVKP